MSEVIDLSKRRQPVYYTILVRHDWDGTIDLEIQGIEQSPHGDHSVATALRAAAEHAEQIAAGSNAPPLGDE